MKKFKVMENLQHLSKNATLIYITTSNGKIFPKVLGIAYHFSGSSLIWLVNIVSFSHMLQIIIGFLWKC